MIIDKLLLKQGQESNIPILDIGEPSFTTDKDNFFIGSSNGNIQFAKQNDLNIVSETINNSMLVEPWSNIISYSLTSNKIVIHNNNFYKCKVANSTIGSFIEEEWQLLNGNVNNTLPSYDGTSSTVINYDINTLPTY